MKTITLKRTLITAFLLGVVGLSGLFVATQVGAADARTFNPGRIIDDAVFTNNNSMSVAQIQNFLNSKNSTCLKNFSTLSLSDDNNDGQVNEGGSEPYGLHGSVSAAQVIKSAADIYKINPQVILVTLEKEQGLVTRQDCPDWRYNTALGYGCPDTAPCNQAAYGFTRQIDFGVYHLRGFYDDSLNTVPFGTGNYRIYHNPGPYNNTSKTYYGRFGDRADIEYCGSTIVNIQNRATASLYSYTPYQPNQASLDAGYGSALPCGAYGNRNFFLYFTDWFGSTYTDAYSAQFNAQSPLSEPFYPGESTAVYLQYKNMGSARWYDDTSAPTGVNPVHLAASVPTNRQSAFSFGWPSDGRPSFNFTRVYEANGTTLAANQHVVEPGQIGKFEFNITPPRNVNLGTHREYFQPVLENATNWNMGGVAWLDITVISRYEASFYLQSEYPKIKKNSDIIDNYILYKNSGSAAWYDTTTVPAGYYPTQLITSAPIGRQSTLAVGWPSKQIAADLFSAVYEANGTTLSSNQHIVMPGQIAKFNFKFAASANTTSSSMREYFQPVIAGSPHPTMGAVSWLDASLIDTSSTAQFAGQSPMPTVSLGQSAPVFLQYKNIGTARWYDDTTVPQGLSPVHLAASVPTNRQSVFSYTWPSNGRPNFNFSKVYEADGVTLATNQHIVEPGQIARFEFSVTAPWNVNLGTHREHFQPVLEKANMWGMGSLSWLDITVRP